MKKCAEILAPAGSPDALKSAVINGADAVYLGLDTFSARAGAENFNIGNLREWIEYAHFFGVKVYVAVNTLIKQSEIDEALNLVRDAWNIGADAFIVQDLGLIRKIRLGMPDIVLHGSTQMGIHNCEGAVCAESMGLKRVVLARETPLDEIKRIKAETALEIEYFVHGALCVAFSGNCYISSALSGLSGNRGRCLQLCRKYYRAVCDGKRDSGYLLSAADICMLKKVGELTEAGVDSFKIEGRLRRKEYVGEAVRIYKKALTQTPDENDIDSLKLLFNRGEFCDGYLSGKDVIYPYVQNNIGLKVGVISSVGKVASFKTTFRVEKGDGLKFLRDKRETGGAVCTGENCTTYAGKVAVGDEVRITTSSRFMREIDSRSRKRRVRVTAGLYVGRPVEFCAESDGISVREEGDVVAAALKTPVSRDDVLRVLNKSGEDWAVEATNIDMEKNVFIPMSALNESRRRLYEKLRAEILKSYDDKRAKFQKEYRFSIKKIHNMSDIVYKINEDLINVDFGGCNVLYCPDDYSDTESYKKALNVFGDRLILDLPIIADRADIAVLSALISEPALRNVCANNLYGITLGRGKNALTGYGLNCMNLSSGCNFVQSAECENVLSSDAYVYAFGYFPLMTFRHCPRRTVFGSCNGCEGDYNMKLSDDKGNFFIKHYRVAECYARLCNSLPVDIRSELDGKGHKRRIIDLCGVDRDSARAVVCGGFDASHIHFNFNKRLV